MPDLVDRIRSEVEARIRELRPVARELERLARAAAAFARTGARSVPGLRSRVGTRASAPRAGRTAARTGKPAPSRARPEAVRTAAPRRRPAPRGQTREKVLEALAAAPGGSSAAVARAAGISRAWLQRRSRGWSSGVACAGSRRAATWWSRRPPTTARALPRRQPAPPRRHPRRRAVSRGPDSGHREPRSSRNPAAAHRASLVSVGHRMRGGHRVPPSGTWPGPQADALCGHIRVTRAGARRGASQPRAAL